MDVNLKALSQELSALTQRFADLGGKLGDAARALEESGAPPADGLVSDLAGARSTFIQLRTDLLAAAEAASVSPKGEPESLTELEPLIDAIQAALVMRAKLAALEHTRGEVLATLDRVLTIVHRDDPKFAALAGCHRKAGALRDSALAISDPDAPEAQGLAAGAQAFVDFLAMVENRDGLDDERYGQLEESVTKTFGRPLAVAVARGRLGFPGDIVEPPPAPEPPPPEPVLEAPEPEARPILAPPPVEEPRLELDATEPPPLPEPITLAAEPTVATPEPEPPTLEVPALEVPALEVPALTMRTVEMPAAEPPPLEPVEAPVLQTPTVEMPTVEMPALEMPRLELETREPIAPPEPEPPAPSAPVEAVPEPAPVAVVPPPQPAPPPEPSAPDETAQWWLAAWARWSGWKSTHDFADVVREELGKYPYLLAVPIQKSPEYDDGLLAYGYSILIDHVEKQNPGCVGNALNSLKPGVARPVGDQLYDYLVTEGRLSESYPEFVKNTLLAAIPDPGLWFQFRILESKEDTRIFQRPSARLGDTELSGQRLASDGQRYTEHKFKMTLPPLTTRCVQISAEAIRDARGVGVKIGADGSPCDSGWVAMVPAGAKGKTETRRIVEEGTHVPGLGKDFSTVWIAVYNPDPATDRRYDLSIFLRKDTKSPFRGRS